MQLLAARRPRVVGRLRQAEALTPDRLLAAALGFGFVALPGFSSGGYSPGFWGWTTLALACVVAARLVLSDRVVLSRAEAAMLAVLGALALWMWLSGVWAVAGADASVEARRALLYFAALAALVLCVEKQASRALIGGAVLGIVVIAADALWSRVVHTRVVPIPIEGTRLVGPLGYANALGVLVSLGLLLVVGLAATTETSWLRRALLASTVVLSVALALSESRGAWLALAAGAAALLAVSSSSARSALASVLLPALPVDVAAMVLSRHVTGPLLGVVLLAGADASVEARRALLYFAALAALVLCV
ncbi:MAG: hypothetical protein ACXVYM_06620, partial [Gaiellaceae bacterium]